MDTPLIAPALASRISSDVRNIRFLTPKILRIKGPYLVHGRVKAGNTFLLYQIMLSVVREWPDTPPSTLTHIRHLLRTSEVLDALVYCTHNSISSTTSDDYFESIGRMASGTRKSRDEIHTYTEKLSQRLIHILVPNFITVPREYTIKSSAQNPCKDWSSGCPKANWILPKMRVFLRENVQTGLPMLSLDMVTLTSTSTDGRMQALETVGDRALEFLFEFLWLSMDTPMGLNAKTIRDIVLSNKMFSILGPVLGINWQHSLPPVRMPSTGAVIKLVADMFEARIGAIVTRPRGPCELEDWWFRNMPNIIKHVIRLLDIFENPYKDHCVIGKRQRSDYEDKDEDEDGDGDEVHRKRMRLCENKSSFELSRPSGKENLGLLHRG